MTILFAILLFSLLIFVHELGHFAAAKLSGVQVNEFSMFMGPALIKWQRGETLYAIRCIPFGGYCAMEGENEDSDNPRSFRNAAWWKQFIILIAGAAMNFIIGFAMLGLTYASIEAVNVPVIVDVTPGCTIVAEDGLHVGDRFLEIDGEKIYMAGDFSMILSVNTGDVHDVVVERNGKIVELDDFYMEKHLFPGEETEKYGITFGSEQLTFSGKLKYAGLETINVVRSVRLSLVMLFSGQAGFQDMMGPAGLVKLMSDTASSAKNILGALMNMLYLGGYIAVNLAVMNLLPIPALDGGRVVGLLLTTGIESVTRKKIDAKYEGYIHGVGLILLLILMIAVTFKDVIWMFKG